MEVRYIAARPDARPADTAFMGAAQLAPVRAFHQTIPEYRVTELARLPGLARRLGLESVLVKDESTRFGLGAFKGLGGVWAMARVLARDLAVEPDIGFPELRRLVAQHRDDRVTFVTATAANHGRGVAWAARRFGCRAVVFVPTRTRRSAIEAIRSEGARVEVRGDGFDEVVGHAASAATANGWILLQDTAWDGYTEIPRWVLQGYGTLVIEALEQISAQEVEPPTHAILQVGVGSFAAAVAAGLAELLAERLPAIFTTEPAGSAPLFASAEAGRLIGLERAAPTSMSCLACTDTSPQAWPILRALSKGHFACDDAVTDLGQADLAAAREGDSEVLSGASGALGAGTLVSLCRDPALEDLRGRLGLGPRARVLVVSTEGPN